MSTPAHRPIPRTASTPRADQRLEPGVQVLAEFGCRRWYSPVASISTVPPRRPSGCRRRWSRVRRSAPGDVSVGDHPRDRYHAAAECLAEQVMSVRRPSAGRRRCGQCRPGGLDPSASSARCARCNLAHPAESRRAARRCRPRPGWFEQHRDGVVVDGGRDGVGVPVGHGAGSHERGRSRGGGPVGGEADDRGGAAVEVAITIDVGGPRTP